MHNYFASMRLPATGARQSQYLLIDKNIWLAQLKH